MRWLVLILIPALLFGCAATPERGASNEGGLRVFYIAPTYVEGERYALTNYCVATDYAKLEFDGNGTLKFYNLTFTEGLVEFRAVSDCAVSYTFTTSGNVSVYVDGKLVAEGKGSTSFSVDAGRHFVRIIFWRWSP